VESILQILIQITAKEKTMSEMNKKPPKD
jgi:hypothetical protein